ncbi:MAG: caspase family protein [Pseudomonadota bacterium]|nr:caspase family protein [Pseudomonadota bacterium]
MDRLVCFHRIAGALLLVAMLALNAITNSPAHANEIVEQQRLLWALGYGTTIDGRAGADTGKAISEFLSARRGGTSLSGSALTQALQEELDKEFAKKREELSRPVISTALPIDFLTFLYVSKQRNRLHAGSCGKVHMFRLDNLRPVDRLVGRNCSANIAYSERDNAFYETYSDGVVKRDTESGIGVDYFGYANDFGIAGKGLLLPGETGLVVARDYTGPSNNDAAITLLDLNSRQYSVLYRHRRGLSTGSISVSDDGRYLLSVGEYPDKPSQTLIYDMTARKIVREYPAAWADISGSGKFVVLITEQKDDKHRIEVREIATNKVVGTRAVADYFDGPDSGSSGHSLKFLNDDATLAYFTIDDGKGVLHGWNLASGAVTELAVVALDWGSVIDIRPELGQVFVASPWGVDSTPIGKKPESAGETGARPSTVSAAQISADRKTLAVIGESTKEYGSSRLWIIDLESGAVKHSLELDYDVETLRFRGQGKELVLGDDDGKLVIFDTVSAKALKTINLGTADGDSVVGLDVSRHGDLAVTAAGDDWIRIVDLDSGRVTQKIKPTGDIYSSYPVAFVDNDRRILGGNFHLEAFDVSNGRRVFSRQLIKYVDARTYYKLSPNHIAKADPAGSAYWVGASGIPGGAFYKYSNGAIVQTYGAEHDTMTYSGAYSRAGAPLGDGWMAWTGDNAVQVSIPEYQSWPIKETYQGHAAEIFLVEALADGRLISTAKDGTVQIYDRGKPAPRVIMQLYRDGNWIARVHESFFAGTEKAARSLFVRVDYDDVHTIDNLYDTLYRPDLVAEALRGDPAGKLREASEQINLTRLFAEGPPPRVRIVSPQSGSQAEGDSIEVTAEVEERGKGTGRIEWRVNGITLGVDRGLERLEAKSGGRLSEVKKRLWLEPGENLIEVVAYNPTNAIATDPVGIKVNWSSAGGSEAPTLYVLSVGVNDYWDSRLQLKYARRDAEAVAEAFRQSAGGLYASVQADLLIDDKVTTEGLGKAFDALSKKVRPRDVFVFFLAGHGKTIDGRYYFIPQNFRYDGEKSIVDKGIGQEKWQSWFSQIPARKSILLYDTCESGSLTGEAPVVRGLERVAALERMTKAMGRTILSAATDEQPALEGFKGHGVFTYALLAALQDSDGNNNKLIEITELAGHVDAQVPEISFKAFGQRQIPQMKIVGSNFPLAQMTTLKLPDQAGDGAVISRKPTHVVIRSTDLMTEPGPGQPSGQISAGTLVTLLASEGGWSLVARDGRKLGFVSSDSLIQAQ